MNKDQTTEQRIFEAAKKVFIRKGMDGARMQDIADEAGINKALLHYYFRSKEKLFEVIFIEAAQKLFPRINIIFESDLPLEEKVTQFVDQYITNILENPYLPIFVLNEVHKNPGNFMEGLNSKFSLPRPEKLFAQLQEEIEKGTIRPISPFQFLLNLISTCIFPFVMKPMFQAHLGVDDAQFRALMEQRKKELPRMLMDSIKK